MARYLITGGAGFIGSHLCESFLKQGHEVICMDNYSTGAQENISSFAANPRFRFLDHNVSRFIDIGGSAELCPSFCVAGKPGGLSRTADTDTKSRLARHPQRSRAWREPRRRCFSSPRHPRFTGILWCGRRTKSIGETLIRSVHAGFTTKQNDLPRRSRWPTIVITVWTRALCEFSIPTGRACACGTDGSCRISLCKRSKVSRSRYTGRVSRREAFNTSMIWSRVFIGCWSRKNTCRSISAIPTK